MIIVYFIVYIVYIVGGYDGDETERNVGHIPAYTVPNILYTVQNILLGGGGGYDGDETGWNV